MGELMRGPMGFRKAAGFSGPSRGPMSSKGAHRNFGEDLFFLDILWTKLRHCLRLFWSSQNRKSVKFELALGLRSALGAPEELCFPGAMKRTWALQTRYTLRRNTGSEMNDLTFFSFLQPFLHFLF